MNILSFDWQIDHLSYPINPLKIPSEISDHDASVAFLQCPKSVAGSFKQEVWLYDKVDKQKFIEKL